MLFYVHDIVLSTFKSVMMMFFYVPVIVSCPSDLVSMYVILCSWKTNQAPLTPTKCILFYMSPLVAHPSDRATLYVILCLWYIIRPHQPSYKVCYSTFLVEFFIQLHYFLDICYCKFLLLFPDPATVALHILFYIVEKLSPPPLIALHMLTYGSFLISSSSTLVQCMTVYCSGVSLLPVSPTTL